MTQYGFASGKVIDVGGTGFLRGLAIIAGLVVVVILLWASVAYVPAGHVGVLTFFGRVTGDVLAEGTHLVNPFKVNNVMSVRTQEVKESASVPSNEGLIVTMDTSLLFRVNPAGAADLYRTVGPKYIDVVVEPNLRSAIRESTASHSANALYSGEREKVAAEIIAALNRELGKRGVIVENVLLRDIQLPVALKQSI